MRGDSEDVFSKGFLCPKATGLQHLSADPDRLRTPLVRGADGELAEATWDEAFRVIDERLSPILAEHGRDAVAVYVGNPNAHNLSALTYGPVFLKALASRNVFTASSVDQMPKHVSAGLMFGAPLSIPVPDVDRTDHLLILGANPLVSNGSLLTAPDMRGRLRRIRERGGKVVVVDPRRTRTAEVADEHHFIRPGHDAHLLMAMAWTLFDEGLVDAGAAGRAPGGPRRGRGSWRATSRPRPWLRRAASAPSRSGGWRASWRAPSAPRCTGGSAPPRRRSARWPAGWSTCSTCSPATWTARAAPCSPARPPASATRRAGPAAAGDSPSAAGRRGCAGCPRRWASCPCRPWPRRSTRPARARSGRWSRRPATRCVSTPNSGRLARAVEGLDFMLSIDIYVNETTRHADVILPAPGPLEKSQYDLALYQLAARNVANYSPADPGVRGAGRSGGRWRG